MTLVLMTEGLQNQIRETAKPHHWDIWLPVRKAGCLWVLPGNIDAIGMQASEAAVRPAVHFILQEKQRLLNWQCSLSYRLPFRQSLMCSWFEISLCFCVGGWRGSGFCPLGTAGVGAGGQKREPGCSYRVSMGGSEPQTSQAPLSDRKKKENCSDPELLIFKIWVTPSRAYENADISMTKPSCITDSRFPKGVGRVDRHSAGGRGRGNPSPPIKQRTSGKYLDSSVLQALPTTHQEHCVHWPTDWPKGSCHPSEMLHRWPEREQRAPGLLPFVPLAKILLDHLKCLDPAGFYHGPP